MQDMFGRMYPLIASASFAALAVYYAVFYDSPDRFMLTGLSFSASLGWLCLHGAECVLARVMIAMEGTTKILEMILNQTPKE